MAKVLVVGGGGREHAIAWKLAQSEKVDKVYAAPGNPGIAQIGECLPFGAGEIEKLAEFAEREGIDLTVVGPEAPLVAGIADEFQKRGLKIFGPSKRAAMLEGSKAFAKEMMVKFGVPTADFKVFENPEEAKEYVRKRGAPLVVKADGLAAGKGVVVARSTEEALEAIDKIMVERLFKEAGKRVVIEDFLEGEEASYLVITDGERYIPLATSQDHKAVFDGDRGPNTGGMGAYSPAPVLSEEMEEEVKKRVIEPILKGMRESGRTFRGILYAGLMITKEGVKVLEFNVRFGDPEAQTLLRRLDDDIYEVFSEVAQGELKRDSLSWKDETSICVVLASKGYPIKAETGKEITGIEEAEKVESVKVFHAGTKLENGKLLTAGGRVLNVTALGKDIREARERAYRAVQKIHFDGMHYRRDIGEKALRRGGA